MKDYTDVLKRLAIERRGRSFGSPSDQEIAVQQLADMAENHIPALVEELQALRATPAAAGATVEAQEALQRATEAANRESFQEAWLLARNGLRAALRATPPAPAAAGVAGDAGEWDFLPKLLNDPNFKSAYAKLDSYTAGDRKHQVAMTGDELCAASAALDEVPRLLKALRAALPPAPATARAIGTVALAAARRDGSGLTEEEFAQRVGGTILAAHAPAPATGAAQAAQEAAWVPVGERLPEYKGYVAAALTDGRVIGCYCDPGFNYDEDGETGTVPPMWDAGFYNDKVTHWRPLPAPPATPAAPEAQ